MELTLAYPSLIHRLLGRSTVLLFLLCASALGQAQSAKAQLLWLGQSAFRLTTPSGKVIVIDPWLRLNSRTPAEYKDLSRLGKVDLILVTHGHFDHIADAPALAMLNQARVFAPGDLNQTLTLLQVLPPELAPRMNKGGTVTPFADVPGLKITAVHAEHSSLFVWKNPATSKDEVHVGGEPVGFIIELENGQRIYHMGDTGLFGDLKFIGEYYKPDVLLIPIGGNFTMGPVDAAFATREWLHPKIAIPMHYGSNPLGKGTPQEYQQALGQSATQVRALQPGEQIEF
jgi:L-ascorbate metabolism protein UlaG (beta-lactamase superfamily)